MRLLLVVCMWMVIALTPARADVAFDHQHEALHALLAKHVHWAADGHASHVNYAGLQADRPALKAYLQQLQSVALADFNDWSKPQRMAFLINAYNAWTVELILTRYPDLTTIKELGSLFSSPWKQAIAPLLGENRSLDDIEHGLLRGAPDFSDPRIHFAVNCASIGCPALRPEAYTAAQLEAQLADQTMRFLSDRSRNRVNAEGDALEVSKLFDWYADDFKSEVSQLPPPAGFLAQYAGLLSADPKLQQRIRDAELSIGFLDYDWALNSIPAAPSPP